MWIQEGRRRRRLEHPVVRRQAVRCMWIRGARRLGRHRIIRDIRRHRRRLVRRPGPPPPLLLVGLRLRRVTHGERERTHVHIQEQTHEVLALQRTHEERVPELVEPEREPTHGHTRIRAMARRLPRGQIRVGVRRRRMARTQRTRRTSTMRTGTIRPRRIIMGRRRIRLVMSFLWCFSLGSFEEPRLPCLDNSTRKLRIRDIVTDVLLLYFVLCRDTHRLPRRLERGEGGIITGCRLSSRWVSFFLFLCRD